ncbi:PHP domain-containing protein [Nocardioides zeae]|uniref:PHP domain-containing protein n=1 Tax=Nocardioides imazamoxiresistens TaxID=3231893 RepID=A0ABU3PZC5_9ACTN|nr:PHP domain-containing protein [Nocardioides zeae]MDT9594469.1 PHP domain-containing protein [Nocardioides zeae]
MSPLIDLHTHSSRSDGTQTPAELMRSAAAAGLDVVALTDHDTSAGWDEAAAAAAEAGVALVRGMEISTVFRGRGVHLLAYLPDPTHPDLRRELDAVLAGRDARVPGMVERLRGLGLDVSVEQVRRLAGPTAAVGRPHVADALVAGGYVASRKEAFDRYLSPGRPAYRNRAAADLETMLDVVAAAGGVSVVAHPWGRHDPGVLDAEGLAHLQQRGLLGVEVDHQDHGPAEREGLRRIAAELDLLVTGSSDHHGEGKVDHDLGCNTTTPDQLERLLDAAAAAAATSGRTTPQLLQP